jgi:hypothetical protein
MFKQAFVNQYNLILLGGSALFSLALSSPDPLLIGLGGEVVWLALGAPSRAFRNWVAAQAALRRREAWAAEVGKVVAGLPRDAAARVRAWSITLTETMGLAADAPWGVAPSLEVSRLGRLLQGYARLAGAHQRLARLAADARGVAVEAEIVRLGQLLANEKDPALRLSLRHGLGLLQRRLKQIEQVEGICRTLELKLSTLERSTEYLATQLLVERPAPEIEAILDEMLTTSRFNVEAETEAATALARARITGVVPVQR